MITYFDPFITIAAWVFDLSHSYVLLDKANTLHYTYSSIFVPDYLNIVNGLLNSLKSILRYNTKIVQQPIQNFVHQLYLKPWEH